MLSSGWKRLDVFRSHGAAVFAWNGSYACAGATRSSAHTAEAIALPILVEEGVARS